MTTRSEISKLFNYDADTTRIVGFGVGAGIAFDANNPCAGTVAIMTALADPKTKKRTDKQMFLALSAEDAMSLATAILAHADKCGWKTLEQPEIVQIDHSPKNKQH